MHPLLVDTIYDAFGSEEADVWIVKLWNFDIFGTGEKHHWLYDFDKLSLCDLVHLFQFSDVSREVRRVVRSHG